MSLTNLLYHIVFSTKERRPDLNAENLPRVCEYMGGVVRNMKGSLLLANGVSDHVHLVARVPPNVCISDLLRTVKCNTTDWIHETLPERLDFAWQEGYAAFTLSKSALPQVLRYVKGQEAHHHKMSFKEEFLALLDKHEIEYDERYLWK